MHFIIVVLCALAQIFSTESHGIQASLQSVYPITKSAYLIRTLTNEFFIMDDNDSEIRWIDASNNISGEVHLINNSTILTCDRYMKEMHCSLLDINLQDDRLEEVAHASFRMDSNKVVQRIFEFLNAPHLCIAQSLDSFHSTISLPMFSCRGLSRKISSEDNNQHPFGFMQIPRSGHGLKSKEAAVRVVKAISPMCSDDAQIEFIHGFADKSNIYFISRETQLRSSSTTFALYRMCNDQLNLLSKLIKVPLEWHSNEESGSVAKIIDIKTADGHSYGFGIKSTSSSEVCLFKMRDIKHAIYVARQNCYRHGNVTRGLCILKADERCHAIKGWNESPEESNSCAPDQYDLPHPIGSKQPVRSSFCIDVGNVDNVQIFTLNNDIKLLVSTSSVEDGSIKVELDYYDTHLNAKLQSNVVNLADDILQSAAIYDNENIIFIGSQKVHRIKVCDCIRKDDKSQCAKRSIECAWKSEINQCLNQSMISDRKQALTKRYYLDSIAIKKVLPSILPINGTRITVDLHQSYPQRYLTSIEVEEQQCVPLEFIHRNRVSCHIGPIKLEYDPVANATDSNFANLVVRHANHVYTLHLPVKTPVIRRIHPTKCIASGGSILSIEGYNLDIGWRVSVFIGPDTQCSVISVSKKLIKCRLEHTNTAIDQLAGGMFQDVRISFDNNTNIILPSKMFVAPDPVINDYKLLPDLKNGVRIGIIGTNLNAVQSATLRFHTKLQGCPIFFRAVPTVISSLTFRPAIPVECISGNRGYVNLTIYLDAHRVTHKLEHINRISSGSATYTFTTPAQDQSQLTTKEEQSFAPPDRNNGSTLCLTNLTETTSISIILWDCQECVIFSRSPICCRRFSNESRNCTRRGVYVHLSNKKLVHHNQSSLSYYLMIIAAFVITSIICVLISIIGFIILRPVRARSLKRECECYYCCEEMPITSSCSSTVPPFNEKPCVIHQYLECDQNPSMNAINLMDAIMCKKLEGMHQPLIYSYEFAHLLTRSDFIDFVIPHLNDRLSFCYSILMRVNIYKFLQGYANNSNQISQNFITYILMMDVIAYSVSQKELDICRVLLDTMTFLREYREKSVILVRCGRNLFPVNIDSNINFETLNRHLYNHIPNIASLKMCRIDASLIETDTIIDRTVSSVINETCEYFPIIFVTQLPTNYYQTVDDIDNYSGVGMENQSSLRITSLLLLWKSSPHCMEMIPNHLECNLMDAYRIILETLSPEHRNIDLSRFKFSEEMKRSIMCYVHEMNELTSVEEQINLLKNTCSDKINAYPFNGLSTTIIQTTQCSYANRWYNLCMQYLQKFFRRNNDIVSQFQSYREYYTSIHIDYFRAGA